MKVCILFFPDLNIFLSIDGNGSRNWDSVTMCINNDRCFLRTSCDVSTLIYKLVDAMIDGVYPLLDVYGDTIENLEFVMMISDGKTDRVLVCMLFDSDCHMNAHRAHGRARAVQL